jgi:hypothetical protein
MRGRPYRPAAAGTMKVPIVPAGPRPPVGSRLGPQPFVPPSPWSGDWVPDDAELMRWGASAELIAPSAVQPGEQTILDVSVMDCTLPMPLPCILTLVVEWTSQLPGSSWQDRIEWTANLGVGRSACNIGPTVLPKGAPFATGRPYAPDVVSLQFPLRQVSIAARLVILPPPTPASLGRYKVTASLAPFG